MSVQKAVGDPTKTWTYRNPEVKREGTEIILPAKPRMELKDAIDVLYRMDQADNMEVTFDSNIIGFPHDAALALDLAIKEKFGVSLHGKATVQSMMGSKEVPPTTKRVEVAYGEYRQVMWGSISIPGVPGKLDMVPTEVEGCGALRVFGNTLKKYEPIYEQAIAAAQEMLATNSVYKGSAWIVPTNDRGEADFGTMGPSFFDTGTYSDPLILSRSVEQQIETNLWTPIRHAQECRDRKIPLKRGVLLEGTYGTGKTLTARLTANLCVENGWTFILVPHAKALPSTLDMIKRYKLTPAVPFVEDIDRVTDGERKEEMDTLLNTIDGAGSKNVEIITVLTTNALSKMHRAVLRPGRIDALITVTPPDAEATERLIRHYGAGQIEASENIKEVSELAQGCIPAFIREITERAKLAAVTRSPSKVTNITNEDLMVAWKSLGEHLKIMSQETENKARGIGDHFQEMFNDGKIASARIDDMADALEDIKDRIN